MTFRASSLLAVLAGLSIACLAGCSASDAEADDGAAGAAPAAPAAPAKGEVTAQNPYGLTQAQCEASPAPAVFTNGLCVCGDFKDVGNFVVGSGADGSLGSVGVNGTTKVINNTKVAGAWASGKGVSAIGNFVIARSLYTPADLNVAGNVEISQNLHVGGGLSGFGRLAVKGELGVRGESRLIGYQQVATRGSYKDAAAAPCGCKGDPGYLDVGAAVDRAKKANDNVAKKVPTALGAVGFTDLSLDTGSYYFGGAVKSIGFQRIRVKGAVSIYIDGSLEQIGAEVFDITDGSTLDLYVRGTVRTIGHFRVGDTKHAAALRIFIGGADEISLAIGNQIFHGAIYAPDAKLKYIGNTIVEGALFAGELTGIGNVEIRAARPKPPAGCKGGADAPAGGGSSDGTTDPGGLGAQRDDGVGTPVVR